MTRVFSLFFALILSTALLPSNAYSATYNFDAIASNIDPALTAAGYSATSMSGRFSYDPATSASFSSLSLSAYDGALTEFNVSNVSGSNTATSPTGDIDILNNFGGIGGFNDQFNIAMNGFSNPQLPQTFATDAVGYSLFSVALIFIDSSESVFLDSSLPSMLNLDDFDRGVLTFLYTSGIRTGLAEFELTRLSVVPLPAGFLLLLVAVGLLSLFRRVGSQQNLIVGLRTV